MSEYKLQYHRRFSLAEAEAYEYYTLWELRKNWLGREKWRCVIDWCPGVIQIPLTGDKKWAKKIAKELGIEMPNE